MPLRKTTRRLTGVSDFGRKRCAWMGTDALLSTERAICAMLNGKEEEIGRIGRSFIIPHQPVGARCHLMVGSETKLVDSRIPECFDLEFQKAVDDGFQR